MNIAITGGTGFIGKALVKHFVEKGDSIYILTRNPDGAEEQSGVTYIEWLNDFSHPEEHLPNIDVIINLAGTSINSGRWSRARKHDILHSRIVATQEVIRMISCMAYKPCLLINASAIGYYGTSHTTTFTEDSSYRGEDFLSDVVYNWENEALSAEQFGVRTVLARFGLVLSNSGGAFPKMMFPYKFFIGGTVGIGHQWLSWIHIDDLVELIDYTISCQNISGPINFTAPEPSSMKSFGQKLAKSMRRPHWLPVPSFALKFILGEMSDLLLKGQRVIPEKALANNFSFKFDTLQKALENLNKIRQKRTRKG